MNVQLVMKNINYHLIQKIKLFVKIVIKDCIEYSGTSENPEC